MNEGLLGWFRAARKRDGFLTSLISGPAASGADILIVIVWAVRERGTPPGHGAPGVELGCVAEGSSCLLVIKAVNQREALIEISLGFRLRRRDGMVQSPKTVEQRRHRSVAAGFGRMGVLLAIAGSRYNKDRGGDVL